MTQFDPTPDPVAPAEAGEVSHAGLTGMIRSGMLWNLVTFIAAQGSGFVIFLILAMRLPPEIFGVVALASILADIVAVDGRYACMDAVMQAGRYDKTSLNSSFFGFFGVATIAAIAMCFGAPFAAAFYHAPLIAQFMPVFGIMLLPVPWLAVMDAIIMRDLGFKQFTQRNIIGTFAGGAVGIAVAFTPWMVWALVAQRITTLVVTTVFEYQFTRWSPGLLVQRDRVIDFIRRLVPLWTIGSLSQVMPRASALLFGSRYDAATVGLLRAANRIAEAVQGPLVSPLMGLWFPLMAKGRGDIAWERQVYNSIMRTAALLSLPAFAGLIIVSQDLVTLLLPHSYAGVGPIMRAVAITCLMIPLAWFNSIAMTALDMNKTSLIYTVIIVGVALVVLIAVPNVTAAQAIIVMSTPSFFISIVGNVLINRRLQQTNWAHYGGLAPAVLATLIMSAATWWVHNALAGVAATPRLAASVATGGVVYVGWLFLFHRVWLMKQIEIFRGQRAPANEPVTQS